MSSIHYIQVNGNPSTFYEPNMRFGTSYLSSKYRDYAADGEVLMDKATGEILIKRKVDGRIISFYQNKKYINDILLELRVMLTNNTEFTYPVESETGFYVCADYDLVDINSNNEINIIDENTVIPNNDAEFKISVESNGFFARVTTRDTDKAAMEYATNFYNNIFENYSGSETKFIQERQKFSTIRYWKDSNAILYYDVVITDELGASYSYEFSSCVRVNEICSVIFPDGILSDIDNISSITVNIKKIEYYKLQFIENNLGEIYDNISQSDADMYREEFDKYCLKDERILVNYLTIMSFVDKSSDIMMHGKEFIIALMDIPYINRYMIKLSKLNTSSPMILSATKPSDAEWTTNTVWIEPVRTLQPKDGVVISRSGYTSFKALESYIAANGIIYGEISDNAEEDDDFLITEITLETT